MDATSLWENLQQSAEQPRCGDRHRAVGLAAGKTRPRHVPPAGRDRGDRQPAGRPRRALHRHQEPRGQDLLPAQRPGHFPLGPDGRHPDGEGSGSGLFRPVWLLCVRPRRRAGDRAQGQRVPVRPASGSLPTGAREPGTPPPERASRAPLACFPANTRGDQRTGWRGGSLLQGRGLASVHLAGPDPLRGSQLVGPGVVREAICLGHIQPGERRPVLMALAWSCSSLHSSSRFSCTSWPMR